MNWRRWVPSLGDLLFAAIVGQMLVSAPKLLNDGDTGWHVTTGLQILDTGHIPTTDPYSYTMPGTPWTAHEWLAEAVFGVAHKLMGWDGVAWLTAMLVAGAVLGVYRLSLSRGVTVFPALLVAGLTAAMTIMHWLARPHVFTMAVVIGWLWLLERARRDNRGWWLLLPVMLVWVNLHGGFVLGLLLLGMSTGTDLVLAAFGDVDARRRLGPGLAVSVGAALTACVNPQGPWILWFPFHVVNRQWLMDNVDEWQSPNFRVEHLLEVWLVFAAFVLVQARRPLSLFEGALALFNVHAALFAIRSQPLAALMCAPMLAERAGAAFHTSTAALEGVGWLSRVRARIGELSAELTVDELQNTGVWSVVTALGSLALVAVGPRIGLHLIDAHHDPERFPVAAVAWAEEHGIQGRPFHTDSWGGYLIAVAWPRYSVFVDGRSDMYDVPFMKAYAAVLRDEPGATATLDRYAVDWVLFPHDAPLVRTLIATPEWRRVYSDPVADIVLRVEPANAALLEQLPAIP